ncbi:hypothetical protein BS17DRAFT_856269 [Gyrodon lividus]|nr:hypothetical protein BS17DRAFT_856269 [Gyrodon lividus]
MPARTISTDLKARIPVLHPKGYSVHHICHLLGIKTLVYNILYQTCNTTTNPHTRIPARRRTLNTTDITFLSALLRPHPTIYLDELQHELQLRRGVNVSIPTLC